MRLPENKGRPRLLVVQRVSLSHNTLRSRSIGARFGPLLAYMQRHEMLAYEEVIESDIKLNSLGAYDAILFNKHTSCRGVEIIRAAKAAGVTTIYDLDDWILDLPSYSVTTLGEDFISNIVSMIREADFVTVSNPLLASKLKYLRNDSYILPNGFDYGSINIDPLDFSEFDNPRILFSNTDGVKLVSHREGFFAQLVEFLEKYPQVVLDFRGDYFPELSAIPRVVHHGFLENSTYKKRIMESAYWFAIVPLGGDEDADTYIFNSCKSPIKYIDYGSLGIPGVYSSTPAYSDVVVHGETGLLVRNAERYWFEAMELLLLDGDLRKQIRSAAYQDCVRNFGFDEVSKTLEKLVSFRMGKLTMTDIG